nr:hypothetical protein [Tanacetum cinerariifolium]
MEENQGNNSLALMLFESPLEVEPLNMVEPFTDSAINDWSGYNGVVPDLSLSTHVLAINTDVLPSYSFQIWDDQISAYVNEIDRLRCERRRMLSEISALKEKVGRLRKFSLAMLTEESPLEVEPLNMVEPFTDSAINDWSGYNGVVPDLSLSTHVLAINTDVLPTYSFQIWDDQISAYVNEIDRLRCERRRMLSEISALKEKVGRLRHGQSSRHRR